MPEGRLARTRDAYLDVSSDDEWYLPAREESSVRPITFRRRVIYDMGDGRFIAFEHDDEGHVTATPLDT